MVPLANVPASCTLVSNYNQEPTLGQVGRAPLILALGGNLGGSL